MIQYYAGRRPLQVCAYFYFQTNITSIQKHQVSRHFVLPPSEEGGGFREAKDGGREEL